MNQICSAYTFSIVGGGSVSWYLDKSARVCLHFWSCVCVCVCFLWCLFMVHALCDVQNTYGGKESMNLAYSGRKVFFIEVIFKSNMMFFLLFWSCLCSGAFSYNQITFGNKWFPVRGTFLSLLRSFIEDVLTFISSVFANTFVVFCAQSSIFT